MNTKRLKFSGIIAFMIALTVTMMACDLGESEPAFYYIGGEVTVEKNGATLNEVTIEVNDIEAELDEAGNWILENVEEGALSVKPIIDDDYADEYEWTITGDYDLIDGSVQVDLEEDIDDMDFTVEYSPETEATTDVTGTVELEDAATILQSQVLVGIETLDDKEETVKTTSIIIDDPAEKTKGYTFEGLTVGEDYTITANVDKEDTTESILDRTGSFGIDPADETVKELGEDSGDIDFTVTAQDYLYEETEFKID